MQLSKSALSDEGDVAKCDFAFAGVTAETIVDAPAIATAPAGADTDKASANISRTGAASRRMYRERRRARDVTSGSNIPVDERNAITAAALRSVARRLSKRSRIRHFLSIGDDLNNDTGSYD